MPSKPKDTITLAELVKQMAPSPELLKRNQAALEQLRGASLAIPVNRPFVPLPPPRMPHPAESVCRALRSEIKDFEKTIDATAEVGVLLVRSATVATLFHLDDVRHRGAMVVFQGTGDGGRRIRIAMHYSQAVVELTALPAVNDPPKRVGFWPN